MAIDGKQVKNFANPNGTTKVLYEDGVYRAPGAMGSTTFATVEINLGNVAIDGGEFVITGTGFTIGRPVLIVQASGPYTGKGDMMDEAADQCTCTGIVISVTEIKVFWKAIESPLVGNIKFNYSIL
jgi:hypothetical protein